MKNSILFVLLILLTGLLIAQPSSLDPNYYTNDEIITALQDAETNYPDIVKVEIIGYSQQTNMPIYAVKISDNVEVDEDEPEILICGQLHAEEILGVSGVMALLEEILTHQQNYGQMIAQEELWLIPTLNPEGMELVMDGSDTSWRKNQRDVNNNGTLDINPAVGYDIDGVDLNRNFAFNWAHGDTLYAEGGYEVYDYYRGEAPMSESEVQALDQFLQDHNILYSIQWHTSRSGNFSEKCYYSYNWYDYRPSPDLDIAAHLCDGVADQISKVDGSATYERYPSAGRKGSQHDYLYSEYQIYQLLIEAGTLNHQPFEPTLSEITTELVEGMTWLLKRALQFHMDVESNSCFTGIITDATTNEPIEDAGIYIVEREEPFLKPRTTDSYGRFWRAILAGNYTYRVEKEGYLPATGAIAVNPNTWTIQNVALTPATPITITANVSYDGAPLNAQMEVVSPKKEMIQSENGYISYNNYEGHYKLIFSYDGYYPCVVELDLTGDEVVNVELEPITELFSEDWESGLDNWVVNPEWVLIDETSYVYDTTSITTSWDGGYNFYPANQALALTTANSITLPADANIMLEFMQKVYTEWDYDPVTVEVSTNGTDFTVVSTESGKNDTWHRKLVDLSDYAGETVYLNFTLTDVSGDDRLVDEGWTLDNIKLYSGTSSFVGNDEDIQLHTLANKLHRNFPNPFNPVTTIKFDVVKKGTETVAIEIYNILGQRIEKFPLSREQINSGTLTWNADNSASGVYFYKLVVNGRTVDTNKAVLIK